MIHIFLGVIINAPNITTNTIKAVRALLDFIFTCHYDYHDNVSLHTLETCLQEFHSLKGEFVVIGGRKTEQLEAESEEDNESDEVSVHEPRLNLMFTFDQ